MSTKDEIQEIERRVKSLRLPMSFVLERAKISSPTWTRWKNGTHSPLKEKWDAVVAAVEDIERRLA